MIARLEKAVIVGVIQQEPAFAGMFIAHRLARAIRVEADLVDQLLNSSVVLPNEPAYRDLSRLAARACGDLRM